MGQGAGIIGNAADFTDVSNNFLRIANTVDLSTGDIDFAIACWINLDTLASVLPTIHAGIAGKWSGDPADREWGLVVRSADNQVEFTVGASGSIVASSFGALVINTWYFIFAWHDAAADTLNISINDGAVDSGAYALGAPDTDRDFSIGVRNAEGGGIFNFDGQIDSFSFWKRLLTAGEITSFYNGGAGLDYESF